MEQPLDFVGLPPLMELTAGGPAVTVALIDGPVALDHPDLAAHNTRLLPARSGASCSQPESVACTHGTLVAGILHAKRDSPVRGICPGCTLLVRPIFAEAAAVPEAEGVPSAAPLELAAALYDVIEADARIVNLSVGLAENSSRSEPVLDRALEYATRRGVIVLAAAGNEGTLGSSAITRHPWVVPVVACDGQGRALAQSNLGASIGRNGVMAPGQDIVSLAASGGYGGFSGSSAAVPFVTGTVALLWSMFTTASAGQLRFALTAGSGPRRSVTPPVLNAWAAYQALESIKKVVHA
jgi:subtilisin family serine protease